MSHRALFARSTGFLGALALWSLFALGYGASAFAAPPPLAQLHQAQANISALVEGGDTHAKATLEAARADLAEITGPSLWVDPSDAVPPPEGQVVFAKATAAVEQLDRILSDRTVNEGSLLATRGEILEAEADLAASAAEQAAGFHAGPGTPAAKWKAAYREVGKQLTDAVTSLPQATFDAAASNYANALREKTTELYTTPQTITGSPLSEEGKPELFYYGAEGCPYCAIERWSMLAALSRFGKFAPVHPMVSSTTDEPPATRTLTFSKVKYKSAYVSFVPDEAFTNQPPCGSCEFWSELQPPTAAEQELINAYDIFEFEGHVFHAFPFLDVGNAWATVGSTDDPSLLAGMSWQQVTTAMADPASMAGQAIDGGAEIITAQICAVDGGQPAHICESVIVRGYWEGLKNGF